MASLRLFIAIDISEEQKAAATQLLDGLKKGVSFTRAHPSWVSSDALHLTLKFLGSVEEERVEEIAQAVAPEVFTQAYIKFRINGLGVFPDPKRPSVLWAGVDQGRKDLVRLAEVIDRSLEPLNFERERRAFHPHLTLARIKSLVGVEALMSVVKSHQHANLGLGEVKQVVLYSSHLSPEGAHYEALRQWPLRAKQPEMWVDGMAEPEEEMKDER